MSTSCQHDHHHGHHHGVSAGDTSVRNIAIAFVLNLSFAVIELVGGWWTQSIAIQADAIHDFGDSIALAAALGLQYWSSAHPSDRFTFGFKRLSLLSALATSFVLLAGSVFIIGRAVERLANPVAPNLNGMFFLAVLGVAVNGAAAWKMSHGVTQNERALSWHMMEDLLGWVAVLVGSIVMRFADVPWIDAVLSLAIAGIVIMGASRNFWASSQLFLQAAPNVDLTAIRHELGSIPRITSVDSLKVWSLDGAHHVASVQITIPQDMSAADRGSLKSDVRDVFKRFGDFETNIECIESI